MKIPKVEEVATREVKELVSAALLVRAHAELVREKVDEIHREILIECPIYANQFGRTDQILTSSDLYLTNDDGARQDFYDEADKRTRAAGLKPDDMPRDFCPALVAEQLRRDAERRIILAVAGSLTKEQTPEEFFNGLLCLGIDKFRRFIDLVIGLVVNLPDFKNPLERTTTKS